LWAADCSNPLNPRESGHFIPDPGKRNVQTNDVDMDERGLVYVLDRFHGLDIAE
jgi:hypothetical protein